MRSRKQPNYGKTTEGVHRSLTRASELINNSWRKTKEINVKWMSLYLVLTQLNFTSNFSLDQSNPKIFINEPLVQCVVLLKCRFIWIRLWLVTYESLKTKEKSSWVISKVLAVAYGSSHLPELSFKQTGSPFSACSSIKNAIFLPGHAVSSMKAIWSRHNVVKEPLCTLPWQSLALDQLRCK